jgi:hypothetical protein
MRAKEILTQFTRYRRKFPRNAVAAAIEQQQEITPYLLAILDDVECDPEPYLTGVSMAHLYAMHLLAQFREKRAYGPMVRIFSHPGKFAYELVGDTVTEGLGRMLAGIWGGDIRGINSLIEGEEFDGYVRASGYDAHLVLVACGERTRDETVAYFRTLFRRFRRKPSFALDGLVTAALDLHPADLMDHLVSVFRDGLVDTDFVDREDLDEAYRKPREVALEELRQQYRLITDTTHEMSWWACFNDGEPEPREVPRLDPIAQEPVRNTAPKAGRNDPCPCGSGKKYKKCCGA